MRAARKLGMAETVLGTADELTAAQAHEKAAAVIEAAADEREHGPVFRDFADEFMRRHARRWKPATREGNRHLMRRYLVPFFGVMRVADIARADVRRWFDSMSGTPGNANRTLPVLSVMMRQAELWDLRPQGSNPCRDMRRYRMKPRERFLSLDELKRLGFVLDHADDTQAAAAIRLLLFTGARSSEITGLRWKWIRGSRAVLPDSKTGPKAVQLPPPARAVLNGLPRTGPFVFPNRKGDGPMTDLGRRWQTLRALAGLDDVRIHDCRHYSRIRLIPGLTPEAGGERARWALVSGIITSCSGMPARRRRADIVRAACVKARSGPWPALSVSGRRADRCRWSRRIMPRGA